MQIFAAKSSPVSGDSDREPVCVVNSVRHGYEKPAGYTDTETDDHFCIRGQIRIHIHDITSMTQHIWLISLA